MLQVFNVLLNGMPVITDLDIFSKVGKAVAHDEVVQFSVEGAKLFVSEGSTNFDGTLSIQFAKVCPHPHSIQQLLIVCA